MTFLRRKNRPITPRSALPERSAYPDVTNEHWAIWNEVRDATMTSAERVFALCEAIEYLCRAQVPGDIVECGVWRGGSMMAAAKTLLLMEDTQRELWLYDTFSGMSSPETVDIDLHGQSAAELLSSADIRIAESIWCQAGLSEVRDNIASTNYPISQVSFIVGDVAQTLCQPSNLPSRIALLRLDTDWYQSTYDELQALFPRLVAGGVLLIDDYGHWKGCRRAVDEYFGEQEIKILLNRIDYTGRIGIKPGALPPQSRSDVA